MSVLAGVLAIGSMLVSCAGLPAPDVDWPQPSCAAASPSPTPTFTNAHEATKLLVIVLENKAPHEVFQRMPTLAGYAARYGRASASFALTHPSLPNYLAMAGGSTFGVADDLPPSAHQLCGPSVFGQVRAGGRVAKTYAEGMRTPCQLSASGRYVPKHNPWTYFSSPKERAMCAQGDVPAGTPTAGALHHDITAGDAPTFSMLIPDLCNDAHDCSSIVADRWLAAWLPTLVSGPDFRSGRLAVVVTFDEDDGSAGNQIFTAVLHERLHGIVVHERLDQLSVSRSVSRLAGAAPLGWAAVAPDLLTSFGL